MEGIQNKYNISRTDGTQIDPGNFYFVLKLEGNGDKNHLEASRKAILTYANEIKIHLPQLSEELFEKYTNQVEKIMAKKATILLTSSKDLEIFRDLCEDNNLSPLMGYTQQLANDPKWDGASGYVLYDKKTKRFYVSHDNPKKLKVISLC